ncbi:MAG: hypothetical protein PUB35_03445 [Campylobacteraceae bacterium]|nr:hypothetical protein [Campylobacteraceae bacterium]
MRLLRFARNDENSRIPYRDPPVKLGDDTRTPWDDTKTPSDDGYLRNSKILKSRIPSLF